MRRLHFDLKIAFLITSNACVLAWALAEILSEGAIIAVPAFFVFASITCGWYGLSRGRSPLLIGPMSGFVGAAVLAIAYCACYFVGYFFYNGPDEYFEDGVYTELFVYPIVYVVAWGFWGAIFGLVGGVLVFAVQRLAALTEWS